MKDTYGNAKKMARKGGKMVIYESQISKDGVSRLNFPEGFEIYQPNDMRACGHVYVGTCPHKVLVATLTLLIYDVSLM